MDYTPASQSGSGIDASRPSGNPKKNNGGRRKGCIGLALLAAAVLLSPMILAQGNAQVTSVDPPSGKVNDSVTVTGENLGKESVSAVFLSDDKDDFKAIVVSQSADKIVLKIPQVKSGTYHISVQVGDKILIKPIRFTVEG